MANGMQRLISNRLLVLSHILVPAFNQNYQESFTDEATVVEATGHK